MMFDTAVHPFGPVTVTEYEPGAVAVADDPVEPPTGAGPDQRKVYPVPTCAYILVLMGAPVQYVVGSGVEIAAVGVTPGGTTTVAIALQPFASVTVTVYVPGKPTKIV
jgi:hypothetical protein